MIKQIVNLLFDRGSLRRLGAGLAFYVGMMFFSIGRFLACRKKLCVCFDYNNGIYAEFYLSIYRRIKKASDMEAILLTDSISPQWNYDERFAREDFIPQFLYTFLTNKIVIHATSLKPMYLKPEANTRHVQMNHGFGSFVSVLDASFTKNVDMLFANTEHQIRQLKADAVENRIKPKFLKRVGYPKIDGYINENAGRLKRKEVEAVFYGPTYHVQISSIFDFLEPMAKSCSQNNITLYVKLHPFLHRQFDYEKSGGIDWERRLRKLATRYPRVEMVPTFLRFPKVVAYFNKADLFLTDNSGFGYEYVLITGRPIVFLGEKLKTPINDPDQASTNKYRECPEIYYRGRIGPTIAEAEHFEGEFDDIINHKLYDYANEIEAFRKQFTFHLGNAAPYAEEAITELADEMEAEESRKREEY